MEALSPQEQALHDRVDALEDVTADAAEVVNDLFELLDLDALLADPRGPRAYLQDWLAVVVQVLAEHVIPKAEAAGRDSAIRIGGSV